MLAFIIIIFFLSPRLYFQSLLKGFKSRSYHRTDTQTRKRPNCFEGILSQSFGLDREKMHYRGLEKIRELFPDTPVTLLRDVFEKLQLHDLVDLLEKVKPRTLRPAFPMKEMDKLVNARKQRPPKFYRKAEVLIIEYSGRAPLDAPSVERIGSFFQSINSQNQVTKVTVKVPEQSLPHLIDLRSKKKRAEDLNLEKIEQEIKQKEEELQRELQGEKDKFQMAVSLVMDRWICQANDEG